MRTNQTNKFLHSKGNYKHNEKTTYRMGENICKWCGQQGLISKTYKQFIQLSQTKWKMGWIPKYTFLLRRNTDGYEAHEKMINTAYH